MKYYQPEIMKSAALLFFAMVCAFRLCAQPTVSFTFDDGITDDMPGYTFEQWNTMLLDHLTSAKLNAVFFVTGNNKTDDKGKFLLKSWSDRGHKLGNHTFSHLNYGNKEITFERFQREFLKTDSIIRTSAAYFRYFRFPYLKEGDTKEKVTLARTLLERHDYRNGHVTIDGSDWYINSRLRRRLIENPKADVEGFREFYLQHFFDRATYYEDLAFKLTGRHIKHTLLLHHNLASALFLGDLIKMFKAKGWNIIDAEQAYSDEIFNSSPSNIPAGESLIWALAKESGKFDSLLRYPAEDSAYEKDKMDKLGL